uniref:C3H1-type domain-containing protein n=1 Tax=Biomphalaria glabrata TaxID=6526 RepID=A0A2C9JLE9_BIOGL
MDITNIRITLENRSPEVTDAFSQKTRRSGGLKTSCPPPERRSTISSVMPSCIYQNALRLRNLSGGSTTSGSSTNSNQLDNQYFSDNGYTVQTNRSNSSPSSHKKLDRSWSDSDNDRNVLHRSVNSSRYKTELCRPFEESGSCKYGDKCQFAHGYHELRNLARHPKYKTELCRTFHTVGFCPYGPRCHFIHEDETKPEASPKLARSGSVQSSSGSSSPTLSPPSSDDINVFNYQSDPLSLSNLENHQFNAPLSVNINSNFDHALKQLSLLSLNHNNCMDVFSSNNKEPKIIGSEEHDIFSEITMFRAEDLDNAPKQTSSCAMQSVVRLDNFPSVDNFSSVRDTSFWNKENIFQIMRPLDPFHHSPTGSDGCSSGSSSDCGGSTESLASAGFTEWRSPMAIGQY